VSLKTLIKIIQITRFHTSEKEIDYNVAVTRIQEAVLYNKKLPTSLLKVAVEIIETEKPGDEIIDYALALIYEEDKDFVIKHLRSRLYEDKYPSYGRFVKVQDTKYRLFSCNSIT